MKRKFLSGLSLVCLWSLLCIFVSAKTVFRDPVKLFVSPVIIEEVESIKPFDEFYPIFIKVHLDHLPIYQALEEATRMDPELCEQTINAEQRSLCNSIEESKATQIELMNQLKATTTDDLQEFTLKLQGDTVAQKIYSYLSNYVEQTTVQDHNQEIEQLSARESSRFGHLREIDVHRKQANDFLEVVKAMKLMKMMLPDGRQKQNYKLQVRKSTERILALDLKSFVMDMKKKARNMVPIGFVSQTDMRSVIKIVENELSTSKYRLVYPVNENLDIYYFPKLADLKYIAEKNVLSVKLNVPVIKNNSTWKLMAISSLRFTYKNSICSMGSLDLKSALIAISNERVIVIETQENGSRNGCMEPGEGIWMCRVPEYQEKPVFNKVECYETLARNHTVENIQESCIINCVQNPSLYITEITPERIAAANAERVTIECNGISYEYTSITSNLLLDLPCGCTTTVYGIFGNIHTKIYAMPECELTNPRKQFFVADTIPTIWSTLNVSLYESNIRVGRFDEYLDGNWKMKMSVVPSGEINIYRDEL